MIKYFVIFLVLFSISFSEDLHIKSGGLGSTTAGNLWNDSAMNIDTALTYSLASGAAGDRYWLMEGSHTLSVDFDANAISGSVAGNAMISLIGVSSSTTDTAENIDSTDWASDTANWPVVDLGNHPFIVGNSWKFKYIRFTGDSLYNLVLGLDCDVSDCWFVNTRTVDSSGYCIYASSSSIVRSSYVSCPSGGGLALGNDARAIANTIYNTLTVGIRSEVSAGLICINNVVSGAWRGIDLVTADRGTFISNTMQGCDTAFASTNSYTQVILNNVIDTASVGFYWSSSDLVNMIGYSHFHQVTTRYVGVSVTGISADENDSYGDPLFTDSLTVSSSSSPIYNTGLKPRAIP